MGRGRASLLIGPSVGPNAEVLEVCFHVAEVQHAGSRPVVDDLGNLVKARSVATTVPRLQATAHEEVAVDQFVDER